MLVWLMTTVIFRIIIDQRYRKSGAQGRLSPDDVRCSALSTSSFGGLPFIQPRMMINLVLGAQPSVGLSAADYYYTSPPYNTGWHTFVCPAPRVSGEPDQGFRTLQAYMRHHHLGRPAVHLAAVG